VPARSAPRPARGVVLPGRRPRQHLAVDLARGAGRDAVDERQHRHERGGQPLGEHRARGGEIGGPPFDGEVADQDLPPALVFLTAAAAAFTPGNASSAVSISPSSIRRPPSLTWSSARPTKSSPAPSELTRSPVW
jgi:hypothetical protein